MEVKLERMSSMVVHGNSRSSRRSPTVYVTHIASRDALKCVRLGRPGHWGVMIYTIQSLVEHVSDAYLVPH